MGPSIRLLGPQNDGIAGRNSRFGRTPVALLRRTRHEFHGKLQHCTALHCTDAAGLQPVKLDICIQVQAQVLFVGYGCGGKRSAALMREQISGRPRQQFYKQGETWWELNKDVETNMLIIIISSHSMDANYPGLAFQHCLNVRREFASTIPEFKSVCISDMQHPKFSALVGTPPKRAAPANGYACT